MTSPIAPVEKIVFDHADLAYTENERRLKSLDQPGHIGGHRGGSASQKYGAGSPYRHSPTVLATLPASMSFSERELGLQFQARLLAVLKLVNRLPELMSIPRGLDLGSKCVQRGHDAAGNRRRRKLSRAGRAFRKVGQISTLSITMRM